MNATALMSVETCAGPPPAGPKGTIQQQVYRQLRLALMSGHLRPGESVSLRGLAAEFGTSMQPVREALRCLQSEGGLVKGPNRMLTVPTMSVADLREVRDVRLALEGLATGMAAGRITRPELDRLRAECEAMRDAADSGDIDRYLEGNWAFHSTIYRAAGSALLLGLIENLWMRVGPLIRLATSRRGHFAHSMACHWSALHALEAGDGKAARSAIEADIAEAAADLSRALVHSGSDRG